MSLALVAGFVVPARVQAPATGVTAFEGARLVVGDRPGHFIRAGTPA
jgi:hypothetical protein